MKRSLKTWTNYKKRKEGENLGEKHDRLLFFFTAAEKSFNRKKHIENVLSC